LSNSRAMPHMVLHLLGDDRYKSPHLVVSASFA
jgi:hypothetical protein